jgi:hypothetical protein
MIEMAKISSSEIGVFQSLFDVNMFFCANDCHCTNYVHTFELYMKSLGKNR